MLTINHNYHKIHLILFCWFINSLMWPCALLCMRYCLYVDIYACLYACLCICGQVRSFVSVIVYMWVCAFFLCVLMHMWACALVCMRVCVYVGMCACSFACMNLLDWTVNWIYVTELTSRPFAVKSINEPMYNIFTMSIQKIHFKSH